MVGIGYAARRRLAASAGEGGVRSRREGGLWPPDVESGAAVLSQATFGGIGGKACPTMMTAGGGCVGLWVWHKHTQGTMACTTEAEAEGSAGEAGGRGERATLVGDGAV